MLRSEHLRRRKLRRQLSFSREWKLSKRQLPSSKLGHELSWSDNAGLFSELTVALGCHSAGDGCLSSLWPFPLLSPPVFPLLVSIHMFIFPPTWCSVSVATKSVVKLACCCKCNSTSVQVRALTVPTPQQSPLPPTPTPFLPLLQSFTLAGHCQYHTWSHDDMTCSTACKAGNFQKWQLQLLHLQ